MSRGPCKIDDMLLVGSAYAIAREIGFVRRAMQQSKRQIKRVVHI
jgi:hypothetical protein